MTLFSFSGLSRCGVWYWLVGWLVGVLYRNGSTKVRSRSASVSLLPPSLLPAHVRSQLSAFQLLSSLPAFPLQPVLTASRPHADAHTATQEVPIDL